jgi:hypothetical protein
VMWGPTKHGVRDATRQALEAEDRRARYPWVLDIVLLFHMGGRNLTRANQSEFPFGRTIARAITSRDLARPAIANHDVLITRFTNYMLAVFVRTCMYACMLRHFLRPPAGDR